MLKVSPQVARVMCPKITPQAAARRLHSSMGEITATAVNASTLWWQAYWNIWNATVAAAMGLTPPASPKATSR